jgi:Acetyltransferase (GNAT) domain
MIRYLQHHEIDKERWDDCIKRSFNGIIYAYSWYLDVVHPGWESLVNADYTTVMPLTSGKKMGVNYLYNPFFVQQLGVFSVARLTPDSVKDYLDAIPKHFRYCEINLNTFNHPKENGFRFKENLNHELDMIGSYEMLKKEYSDNAKRNIKKAQLNDLQVVHTTSKEEIIALFRSDRGKTVEVLKEAEYDTFRRLLQALDGRGRLHTRGVLNAKGELIAGAFFCDSNGKVIFLFSGNSAEGKEKGAMFFLVDAFIQENALKNLILDFEGSNDPQLARFYKGFGAKECVYLQAKRNTLPWYLRWYKD